MTDDEELGGFGFQKKSNSIIMVAGVGGAGGNAVNHMFDLGIHDVTFMVCNTDKQALKQSQVEIKIQLGKGLGAGNDPAKGREAADESRDIIRNIFETEGIEMVFITAGMGGGTGTGASPVIAEVARELDILTVGVVTLPLKMEGPKRMKQAVEGIKALSAHVDALMLMSNEKVFNMYGELTNKEAFRKADDILASAAKGIAEIVTIEDSDVNIDFADVQAVTKNSGRVLFGTGRASGPDRAEEAVHQALCSPLLDREGIVGAQYILLNIKYDKKETLASETQQIGAAIQRAARPNGGNEANINWGIGHKEGLGDAIEVMVVATGFGDVDIEEDIQEALHRGETTVAEPVTAEPQPEREPQPEEPLAEEKAEKPAIPAEEKEPEPAEAAVETKEEEKFGVPERPAAEAPRRAPFVPPVEKRQPVRPITPGNVLKLSNNDKYADIDEIIKSPAYIRRKAKFVDETGGQRVGKVSLKEEGEQQAPKEEGNTLFG